MAWIISNNQLTNTEFISLPDKPFVGDSPKSMWQINEHINNKMPFVPLMIDLPERYGAFCNATSLSKVTIPYSVKTIGEFAFTHTALKKVKIAPDCTYYSTSFPEGCVVEFYGGGGDYGQLYDGDNYAVIDGDGARVYVKE